LSRLLVRAGAEPGKEFALPETGELKIGRLPGLHITLLDTKVSREHCRVYKQSTGWIVEDMGSRNGTYVNAQRVKKRLLQPGDRLRVGQTEFEYSTAAPGSPVSETPGSAAAPGPALRPTRKLQR
jgi:pSer/pThr/pTyr-binding forkhead associated (FHA) protein